MVKKIAWVTNLLNIIVLTFFVVNNYNPIFGAISCIIAVSTTFIVTIPTAVRCELREKNIIL